MNLYIKRSTARGTVTAPPSKSMAHRHIICAALAGGKSVIRNVDLSQDILATLDCIRALGAKADVSGDCVSVEGVGDSLKNIGHCGNADASDAVMSEAGAAQDFLCRESGSTMRFFMALAMFSGKPSRFFGSETLRSRPFGIYEDICEKCGITFKKNDDHIYVEGRLKAQEYEIAGNVSSQFITGLMFVLPLLAGDSTIRLIPPVESRSYIILTISALSKAGVKVIEKSDTEYLIPGGQEYKPVDITVEGDYSNAAFLDAFNCIGGDVKVEGLDGTSLQGDRVYKDYFEALKSGAAELDISDCPDLGPVLFAVAAANKGGYFTGTKRLKIKESDRGRVMCEELAAFGIETEQEENSVRIGCGLKAPKGPVHGHNDHRIVMSMALLLSLTGGGLIGAEAVNKSYPGFFKDIKSLGIEVDETWNG